MSALCTVVSLRLNTSRDQHRIIRLNESLLSDLDSKKLTEHLTKICKFKFKLKKKCSMRFFVEQTGEELTFSNIHTMLSAHYASTLKNGLCLLVSCGEDYIGKPLQHVFKRQNKQQTIVSVLISHNDSLHSAAMDDLQNIACKILGFLPRAIQHAPMSSETQSVLRQMTKIMSTRSKSNAKGFNDTYRDCTRSIYCVLRDECMQNNNAKPPGLSVQINPNTELISAARNEVDGILHTLLIAKPTLKASANLKFYINTAYYSRWEDDPWPMFAMHDERVASIMKCIDVACELLQIRRDAEKDAKRMNIIIREYRVGDVLGFHTDRDEFVEPICGVVLRNTCKERHSLVFYKEGIKPYMSPEQDGLCWCLRDEARWEYKHGLCAPFVVSKKEKKGKKKKNQKTPPKRYNVDEESEKEVIRTSISFRWFREDATLPVYNRENDL